ncbi:MAG TPA: HAD family hydrolase [Candidatus Saccharimonadales bacterium]|nr:HAD family hydrolase [Candidatus Saccharimonadales bacterium]
MYKALIADIDGTLVPVQGDGSSLDELTIRAVARALQSGVQISVATGRGWASTKPVVQRLGIVDLCIVEGGSCIIDPITEQMVWQKTLDAQVSSEVVAIFKQLATGSELLKTSARPERIPLHEADDYSVENRVIYLLGTDQATALKVKASVDKLPLAATNITTPSWAGEHLYDVHVTNKHGTKEYALDEWFRLMHITKAETIAMGDSDNDLPLFRAAGLKVAVGNATDDLKAAADYIAPDRDTGALRDVLEKFIVG